MRGTNGLLARGVPGQHWPQRASFEPPPGQKKLGAACEPGSAQAVGLEKAQFWQRSAGTPMGARQIRVLNHVLDGMKGKLANAQWTAMGRYEPL